MLELLVTDHNYQLPDFIWYFPRILHQPISPLSQSERKHIWDGCNRHNTQRHNLHVHATTVRHARKSIDSPSHSRIDVRKYPAINQRRCFRLRHDSHRAHHNARHHASLRGHTPLQRLIHLHRRMVHPTQRLCLRYHPRR